MAVPEKNLANTKERDRPRYRPGIFTRFVLVLGVLTYSLLPLVVSWPTIHAGRLTSNEWDVIVGAVVFLQFALWFAVSRCGYQGLTYWEGVSLVAGCMRTGWTYTDMLVGGLSVCFFLMATGVIALTSKPQAGFHRLVKTFLNNRLLQ